MKSLLQTWLIEGRRRESSQGTFYLIRAFIGLEKTGASYIRKWHIVFLV